MNQNDRMKYAWSVRWFMPSERYPHGSIQFSPSGREIRNVTPASLRRLMHSMSKYGMQLKPYAVRLTSEVPSPAHQWELCAWLYDREKL